MKEKIIWKRKKTVMKGKLVTAPFISIGGIGGGLANDNVKIIVDGKSYKPNDPLLWGKMHYGGKMSVRAEDITRLCSCL